MLCCRHTRQFHENMIKGYSKRTRPVAESERMDRLGHVMKEAEKDHTQVECLEEGRGPAVAEKQARKKRSKRMVKKRRRRRRWKEF